MSRNGKLSKCQVIEMLELYKTGEYSIKTLATSFGVRFSTVYYYIDKAGIPKNSPHGNIKKSTSKLICLYCELPTVIRNGGKNLLCTSCNKQMFAFCQLKKPVRKAIPNLKNRKAKSCGAKIPTWTSSNAPTVLPEEKERTKVPQASPRHIDEKMAKAVIPDWLLKKR